MLPFGINNRMLAIPAGRFIKSYVFNNAVVNYTDVNPFETARVLTALYYLGRGTVTAEGLAESLGVTRGFTAGALKLLENEGAISYKKEGKRKIYHLDRVKTTKLLVDAALLTIPESKKTNRINSDFIKKLGEHYGVIIEIPEFQNMLFAIGYFGQLNLIESSRELMQEISDLTRNNGFKKGKFTQKQLDSLEFFGLGFDILHMDRARGRVEIKEYLKPSALKEWDI